MTKPRKFETVSHSLTFNDSAYWIEAKGVRKTRQTVEDVLPASHEFPPPGTVYPAPGVIDQRTAFKGNLKPGEFDSRKARIDKQIAEDDEALIAQKNAAKQAETKTRHGMERLF